MTSGAIHCAGGGTIAGIVVAFLLLMFIIAALAVAFTVFVIMHKRRKGELST